MFHFFLVIYLYLNSIPVYIAFIVFIPHEPSRKHLKTDKITHRMSFHFLLWKLKIFCEFEFFSDNIFSWILVVHFSVYCTIDFIFPSREYSFHWVAKKDKFEWVLVDFFRLKETSFFKCIAGRIISSITVYNLLFAARIFFYFRIILENYHWLYSCKRKI